MLEAVGTRTVSVAVLKFYTRGKEEVLFASLPFLIDLSPTGFFLHLLKLFCNKESWIIKL